MEYVPYIALVVLSGIAAFTDTRNGTIPNWLTLPPLIIAPLAYGIAFGWDGALPSVIGIFVCGLVPLLLFVRQAIAGGDVKLLASIGAIAGYHLGLEIELMAFLVACIYSLIRLAWEGKLLRTLTNALFILVNPVLPKAKRREIKPELMTQLRFGASVLGATLLVLGMKVVPLWI